MTNIEKVEKEITKLQTILHYGCDSLTAGNMNDIVNEILIKQSIIQSMLKTKMAIETTRERKQNGRN